MKLLSVGNGNLQLAYICTGCPEAWPNIPSGWKKAETCQRIAMRLNHMFVWQHDDEDDAEPVGDATPAVASALSPSRKHNKHQLEDMPVVDPQAKKPKHQKHRTLRSFFMTG